MPDNPDPILLNFGKSSISLVELLDKNPSFGPMEQMLIESYLHILHMGYYGWKRRMNPAQDQPASPGSK
jgi:hypothetical protein